jgi:Fuc2NAc and GlcNAc transferase
MNSNGMAPDALVGVLLLAATAYLAGDYGTRLIRQGLLAIGVIDVPNDRSSHLIPTPRGAGLTLACSGVGATVASWLAGWLPGRVGLALIGGGVLVVVLGWLEDTRGIRWRPRLLGQFTAAAWALYWLGGFHAIDLGFGAVGLGMYGIPLALLGIVWGTNFFNFMDGIDGIAAGQATFVGLVSGLMLLAAGQLGLAAVALATAASAGGFLRHNWMPARVFLGDVGSTWLGFTFCVLGVASANAHAVPMIVWGMLLGVFVFDATLTLVRRVRRGYPMSAAHREHSFCRAVRWGWSHARVTTAVGLLNAVLASLAVTAWLWPILLLPNSLLGLALLTGAHRWVEHRLPMEGIAIRARRPALVVERRAARRRTRPQGRLGAVPVPLRAEEARRRAG